MTDAVNAGNPGFRAKLAQPDWLTIRKLREADRGRVASDWVKSLRRNAVPGSWPRLLVLEEYDRVVNAVIDQVFTRGTVLVAADAGYDAHILGWLAFTPGTLHYTAVQEKYRRQGIFRALYAASGLGEGCEMSHLTYAARHLKRKYGWRYVPAFTIAEVKS